MAKVYIGVGHGGSDSGAVRYLVEKDVNLKMALACCNYLKAAGVDVKISRTIYRVQVGAYTSRSNAVKLAKKLNSNGYNTLIVKGGK